MISLHWLLRSTFFIAILSLSTTINKPADVLEPNSIRVPIGGNSWVSNEGRKSAVISKEGLTNWTNPTTTIDTYVRFEKAGTVTLSASMRVQSGESRIRVTLAGQSNEVDVEGSTYADQALGEWTIAKAGYVKITLQGVYKTGKSYAEIADLGIAGPAVDERTAFVRTNEGNFFYWGRRGPSVHLRYPVQAGVDAEWFYNEVTVPIGSDVIGSYYMATGFGEGYFGMQVNSPTERRILFSVWSPFQTDDPKSIPDDQKIRLERKGPAVVTNEFGNEGAGGQSFLRYSWKAGQPYKFLLHATPTSDGYTAYTAYFKAPDDINWQLIARFKRPKTTTYLKSLYSFLENFAPETGNIQRDVEFGNQWIRTKEGHWQELTTSQFTGDNTARKAYRMDYAGGLRNGRFFLQNCGFFNAYTPIGTSFTRPATHLAPAVDINTLP